jgi:hypothetical protein
MNSNTTGSSNVAIGTGTLLLNQTGGSNTAIGRESLLNNTVGSNSALGDLTLRQNTTGERNCAFGAQALYNNTTGQKNIGIGVSSGRQNTTGSSNVYIGDFSGYYNQTTSNNTSVGDSALNSNTTGSNNTAIGYRAAFTTSNGSNNTYVGSNSEASASNQVQLGDTSTTVYVTGTVQTRSDIQDKTDIRDTELGLDFINKIRPVDYKWDYREDYKSEQPDRNNFETQELFDDAIKKYIEDNKLSNIKKDGSKKRTRYHHGVIAQEVQQVIQETGIDFGGFQDHSIKGWETIMSIGYEEFIAPMIKAIQELSDKNKNLESKIAAIESNLNQ